MISNPLEIKELLDAVDQLRRVTTVASCSRCGEQLLFLDSGNVHSHYPNGIRVIGWMHASTLSMYVCAERCFMNRCDHPDDHCANPKEVRSKKLTHEEIRQQLEREGFQLTEAQLRSILRTVKR